MTPASPGGTVADNHPADVHVVAVGPVSVLRPNRGDDTIAVFAIDAATGQLTPVAAGLYRREVAAELRARSDGPVPAGGESAVGFDRELPRRRRVGSPNADRVERGGADPGLHQIPLIGP